MTYKGYFPTTTVTPAPFGLLSVAAVVEHGEDDQNWAGLNFDYVKGLTGYKAGIWATCGSSTETDSVYDSTADERFSTGTAIGITVDRVCSTVGESIEDRNADAEAALDLVTGKAIEQEFWTGTFAKTLTPDGFYLASAGAVSAGTASSVAHGLALLEDAVAACGMGEQAVIHMTRGTASGLGGDRIIERDGVLQTVSGSLVAAGAGYAGTGPDGIAKTFLYATGPLTVHLGPTTVVEERASGGFDATDNTLLVRAERFAAVTTVSDCLLVVQVDLADL
jgi:hypothetical protein